MITDNFFILIVIDLKNNFLLYYRIVCGNIVANSSTLSWVNQTTSEKTMQCERLINLIKSWYGNVQNETMAPARMISFIEEHASQCPNCLADPDLISEIVKITEMVLPESKIPKAVRMQQEAEEAEEDEVESESDEEGENNDDDDDDDEFEDDLDDDDLKEID